MKPNLEANTFNNLLLSDAGRSVTNGFGFPIGSSIMIKFTVGNWKPKP